MSELQDLHQVNRESGKMKKGKSLKMVSTLIQGEEEWKCQFNKIAHGHQRKKCKGVSSQKEPNILPSFDVSSLFK